MKTNDSKLQDRATLFDECVAELPETVQEELNELVKWVSEHGLLQGGGIMSAKELIIQALRFEERNQPSPSL